MRIGEALATFLRGLTYRRIARSLSTILVLALLQVVVPPVFFPHAAAPQASAATLYDNLSDFVQWNNWLPNYSTIGNHRPYQNESTNQITDNGQEIKLTSLAYSASGYLWSTRPITGDFSVSASYYLGSSDGGADGITFQMRPLSAWPNGGSISGSGTTNSRGGDANSIQVRFDTYQNGSERAEDHLNVYSWDNSGSQQSFGDTGVLLKSDAGVDITNIEDGTWHNWTISWVQATKQITIYAGTFGGTQYQIAQYTLSNQTASSYYWGWTGETGGATNNQSVLGVNYNYQPTFTTNPTNTTVAVGGSVTLNANYTAPGNAQNGRWEYQDVGGSWTSTGVSTLPYTFTPTRLQTLRKYRYYIESTLNSRTWSSTSTAATITVIPATTETDTAMTSSTITYGNTPSVAGAEELTPSSSDAFTVAAWIKPTDSCSSKQCTIIAREGVLRLTYSSNKFNFVLWNGDSYTWKILSFASMTLNQWTHVAITRNGSTVKAFINGIEIANYSMTYSPQSSNIAYFYIGNKVGADEPFKGSIDEVKIWKSDRSSTIASDMNSNSTTSTGLVGYWNFNEGSGGIAYNQALVSSAATDMNLYSTDYWDSRVVSEESTTAAYTIRAFYRSYITAAGGWRAPTNVTQVHTLVVGGGGAGGRADVTAYEAGGGGGGGVLNTKVILTPQTVYSVVVGYGGIGEVSTPTNGGNSVAFSLTAYGGGYGGYATSKGGDGGSGGGGTHPSSDGGTGVAGQGYAGQKPGMNGAGGGGGGATGIPTDGTGGVGFTSNIRGSNFVYGDGGGAGKYNGVSGLIGGSGNGGRGAAAIDNYGSNAVVNSGGGGGGAYSSSSSYKGGNGGSGIVIVRWITAAKPIFTQPVVDTTTAGITDTFTVSANPISPLTRSYVWQSSSDTGTTWVNISTGSGFTSQTYTTPILETTTSGPRYQYRVVVTDSDTVGLSITDTSVAVYLVINPRIQISGSYTIFKYGVGHTDTFTAVTGTGTGTKTFTYSPNNRSGITWSSATANSAVLTIAPTLTAGTYYETMTATDSKGASTSLGISIVVNKADTITVTSLARSDTYTGSAVTVEPGYTITGLQNSDTVTAITWSYSGTDNALNSYAASATKPTNAGTYTSRPTPTISNSTSYESVTVVSSTLTVNRATRTLSLSGAPGSLKFGSTATLSATPSLGVGDGSISYASSTTDTCTVTSASVLALKSTSRCNVNATITRGNNYETATSTSASINMAKADSLTVSVNAITPVTYTGISAQVTPSVTVSGLKNSNTASASPVTYTYITGENAGKTCATGGTCVVGDTGPGGGIVFYVASSQQSWGRYLEAAPSNWSGTAENLMSNITKWCIAASSVDGTKFGNLPDGIGQGYANTYNSSLNVCTGGAIYLARNYRGGGYSNWYLPTGLELTEMASSTNRALLGLINDANLWGYWGSNETPDNTGNIGSLVTSSWSIGATVKSESYKNMTRPIRAFSPGDVVLMSSSTPPIDADTYTVRASSLVLSSGSLSDYSGVVYMDGTLRINRAQQYPLAIAQYSANFGTPYKILVYGGSGTGSLSYSVSTGTAAGCTLSGDTITTTSVGTCSITVTKARDKNYESTTATNYVYFLSFIIDQPIVASSSGSNIGISGKTSLTFDTTTPPIITSLSTYSAPRMATIEINGSGFSAGSLVVKFWRNQIGGTPVSVTDTKIRIVIPDGATTGKIYIGTVNGETYSEQSLAITP